MYEKDKLVAAIYSVGKTPRQVSKEISMPEKTFYRKLQTGKWGIDDMKNIATHCGFTQSQTFDIFLA